MLQNVGDTADSNNIYFLFDLYSAKSQQQWHKMFLGRRHKAEVSGATSPISIR